MTNKLSGINDAKLQIFNLNIKDINPSAYNPRKWDKYKIDQLTKSITDFGVVDPLVINSAENRKNIVIGGHFRLKVLKEMGYIEVPCVYVNIPEIEREKELNLRLNKAVGDWDFKLLAEFDTSLLSNVGFSSEELDQIFDIDDSPEQFDLEKELNKLNIKNITIKKGDVISLGNSKLMCGDSTVEEDMLKLMNGEKADMCFTDPPYLLDYLNGKKKGGKATTGFGAKRNRRYLETDTLPDDFTEKWMANINKIQNDSFSIIVYENWKNIRTIWGELEKYWKVKNMIVWRLPNRVQGFSGKYRFFSKHDIAMVGASPNTDIEFNMETEPDGLQEEYETALYAISGKPQWESYKKGKKYQPTDFIDYKASDEKSSGQGVVFGTKPIEILIPYIKVLTRRNELIVEPFGGSGSTLIAATKMRRRCYVMEKSPVYAEVIVKRWEKLTGLKAKVNA
ncbi:MAG: DNA methyltransferase [Patescibacteria group bacterium]